MGYWRTSISHSDGAGAVPQGMTAIPMTPQKWDIHPCRDEHAGHDIERAAQQEKSRRAGMATPA
jgi:hypothetical protein